MQFKQLFRPPKLPGWAWFLLGLVIKFPDWIARLDFYSGLGSRLGGNVAMIPQIIGSPYFAPGLMVLGVGWIVLAGEPRRISFKPPLWLSWIVFAFVAISAAAAMEAAYVVSIVAPERHLSAENAHRITEAIKPYANELRSPVLVMAIRTTEATEYAREIDEALIAGGMWLDLPSLDNAIPFGFTTNAWARGTFIYVRSARHPPKLAQALGQALTAGGVPFNYAEDHDARSDKYLRMAIGYP